MHQLMKNVKNCKKRKKITTSFEQKKENETVVNHKKVGTYIALSRNVYIFDASVCLLLLRA